MQCRYTFRQTCEDFASNWSLLPAGEHVPLHDYMMALAVKMLTCSHFGSFFRHDKATMDFHHLYELVRRPQTPRVQQKASEKELFCSRCGRTWKPCW